MFFRATIFASVLALAQLTVAVPAQSGGTLKVHWLHDKATGNVAMDVSGNNGTFAPISRQFCGKLAANNTINWDGFTRNPMSVNVDKNGQGMINFQGQNFNTRICPAQNDQETAMITCSIPYKGVLNPGPPTGNGTACAMPPRSIAGNSPIYGKSVAQAQAEQRKRRVRR